MRLTSNLIFGDEARHVLTSLARHDSVSYELSHLLKRREHFRLVHFQTNCELKKTDMHVTQYTQQR